MTARLTRQCKQAIRDLLQRNPNVPRSAMHVRMEPAAQGHFYIIHWTQWHPYKHMFVIVLRHYRPMELDRRLEYVAAIRLFLLQATPSSSMLYLPGLSAEFRATWLAEHLIKSAVADGRFRKFHEFEYNAEWYHKENRRLRVFIHSLYAHYWRTHDYSNEYHLDLSW